MMARGYFFVLTTTPTLALARSLAGSLVEERLAACVQVVGPVQSTYRWQGRVISSREWLVVAKTTGSRLRRLFSAVTSRHPYDTPELIALPVAVGSKRYLDWLRSEVCPETGRRKER